MTTKHFAYAFTAGAVLAFAPRPVWWVAAGWAAGAHFVGTAARAEIRALRDRAEGAQMLAEDAEAKYHAELAKDVQLQPFWVPDAPPADLEQSTAGFPGLSLGNAVADELAKKKQDGAS